MKFDWKHFINAQGDSEHKAEIFDRQLMKT